MRLIALVCMAVLSLFQSYSAEAQLRISRDALQTDRIVEILSTAPDEEQIRIELPDAQGRWQIFNARFSNFLSDELLTRRPDFRSFTITRADNPQIRGRISISRYGIDVFTYSPDGFFRIHAEDQPDGPMYRIYNGIDPFEEIQAEDYSCTSPEFEELTLPTPEEISPEQLQQFGDVLRTYNLAIVTTGEFHNGNGGSIPLAETAVMNSVGAMQVIYENELSVAFNLLPPFIYTNPNTDPFEPDQSRVHIAATVIHSHFSISSYDIGHVLHRSGISPNNIPGGGVAILNSVCVNLGFSGSNGPRKAGGWSGSNSNTNNSWIQLFAHEVGHMFGARHTFNGSGGGCNASNHDAVSAFEIGSGSTLMSYQGLCSSSQNIASQGVNDNYFHVNSIQLMQSHILGSGNCASTALSGNTPPVANANPCGGTHTIPKGTPFELWGEGTDQDGDILTYSWEQYNLGSGTQGLIGSAAAASTTAPLFRSFPPTASPGRMFPNINLVNAGNYASNFEPLPSVARTLNFRFTVRDNFPGAGGIDYDNLAVSVSNSGPFSITFPNGGETVTAGTSANVTWAVNGTSSFCSQVNILLSVDGGFSYPLILASGVANNGLAQVNIPTNTPGSQMARIRVECADNPCVIFFDVSDGNFEVVSNCLVRGTDICHTDPLSADAGNPELNLDLKYFAGNAAPAHTFSTQPGSPTYTTVSADGSGNCAYYPLSAAYDIIEFHVTEPGQYTFVIENFGGNDLYRVGNLFEHSFNPASACDTWIASNTTKTGNTSATGSGSFSASLQECTSYFLILHRFSGTTVFSNQVFFSGPGMVKVVSGLPPGYAYTYAAVNQQSGLIQVVNAQSNFTSLTSGDYCVYGLMYKSGGSTPPAIINPESLIGSSINDVISSGNCVFFSNQCKPVSVSGSVSCDASFSYAGTPSLSSAPFNSLGFCQNSADIVATISGNSGGIFQSAPVGLSIHPVNGTIEPTSSLPGTYVVSYHSGASGGCTESIEVIIEAIPHAGTDASWQYCSSDSPFNLFDLLGQNPDSDGTWTGPSPLANGYEGTFDPLTDLAGVYTYTVTGNGTCPEAQAQVVLSIQSLTAICQDATIHLDQDGLAFIQPASLNNNSVDPCQNSVFSLSVSIFQCQDIGINPVELTLTDTVNGSFSTCTANVSVFDILSPSISCPDDISQPADQGACGAIVTFSASASDNCSAVISYSHQSGDFFPVGTTTVTLTATDPAGNTAVCSFDITVTDLQPPLINCPANISITVPFGQSSAEVTVPAVTATDNCSVANISNNFNSGGANASGTYPTGTTQVVFTAEDVPGNTAQCTVSVTVTQDDPDPLVITCPFDFIGSADPGSCGALVTPGLASASGGVPPLTITNNFNAGGSDASAFYPVGITTVVFTVTDAAGNTAQCSTVVTIDDPELPVIQCPGDISQPADQGACGAIVTFSASASDNCSAVISYSHQSGDFFPVGTTTVTLTATDPAGNTAVCSFDITVTDLQPPLINCPANISITVPSGQSSAEVTVPAVTATDNCSVANISNNFNSGGANASGTYPTGSTQVVFTAEDVHGNTAQCTVSVTVTQDDPDPLVITCPFNFIGSADPGSCGALVTPGLASASGGVPPLTITNNFNAGGSDASAFYPVGITTVVFTVTDAAGNTAQCSTVVTIDDPELPVIQCSGDISQPADQGACGAIVTFSASASDNCSAVISYSHQSGDFFPVGTTTVTLTATDPAGNNAVCSFDITVTDLQPPLINCPANISITVPFGQSSAEVTVPAVTATDNCSVANISNNFNSGGANASGTYPTGTTQVVFTAEDVHGNTAQCTVSVTVTQDDPDPLVITCPFDFIGSADPGSCGALVTQGLASASGGVPPLTITNNFNAGGSDASAFYPVGITTVVFTVTDAAGNTAQCSTVVTIDDPELPVIQCPGDISQPADQGACGAVVTFSASASDNCSAVISNSHQSGDFFPVGTTTVTLTATDPAGNTAVCSFDITVTDLQPPLINCPANISITVPFGQSAEVTVPAVTATDNCSVANISNNFNSGGANASGTYPTGSTQVVFTAVDVHGNTAQCTVTVTVIEEPFTDTVITVSGWITTEDGQAVPDVSVTLESSPTQTTVTDSSGSYFIPEIQTGSALSVTAHLDTLHRNGVSTFDMVLMQRHILNVEHLNSPYKKIAADINQNGIIEIGDMIQLRRLILFIDNEFIDPFTGLANNTSWQFVLPGVTDPIPTSPFVPNYSTAYVEDSVLVPVGNANFIAVKIGDLNMSAQPGGELSPLTVYNRSPWHWELDDALLEAGKTYSITVRSSQTIAVDGFQAGFELPSESFEKFSVSESSLPDWSDSNWNLHEDDQTHILMSWNQSGAIVERDEVLFIIRFKAMKSGPLSSMLTLSQRFLNAEAYDRDNGVAGIQFEFGENQHPVPTTALFLHPNPSTGHIHLTWNHKAGESGIITITDLTGRELWQQQVTFYNETHSATADITHLPEGMYILSAKSGDYVEFLRFVILR